MTEGNNCSKEHNINLPDVDDLIFIDASGHHEYPKPFGDGDNWYFSLVAVRIPREEYPEFSKRTDELVAKYLPMRNAEHVEIHGNKLTRLSGGGVWKDIEDIEVRNQFILDFWDIMKDFNLEAMGYLMNKEMYFIQNRSKDKLLKPINYLMSKLYPRFKFDYPKRDWFLFIDDDQEAIKNVLLKQINGDENHEFVDSADYRGVQAADVIAHVLWKTAEREWEEVQRLLRHGDDVWRTFTPRYEKTTVREPFLPYVPKNIKDLVK